jgi:uncharacterized protein
MMKTIVLSIGLIISNLAILAAQNLPRRPFLGIMMENVNEETKNRLKLPENQGVLVRSVIPQSTAEAAGLQKEDVLLKIGEKIIHSTAEAIAIIRESSSNALLEFQIWRQGKRITKRQALKGYPMESHPDIEYVYDEVKAGDNLLRAILTKPKKSSGKLPAVMFLQGVPCYSLDNPLDTNGVEAQMMRYFTRQGFVTLRVEKSGMGDSKGLPCNQLDFKTEAEGYRQGLIKLKNLDYIDSDNIFLLGHSMGGVMAPIIAPTHSVRGIIVYGAITANFMEYYSTSRRSVAQALQMNPEEADNYVKLACECAFKLIREKMTPGAIINQNAECEPHVGLESLRTIDFWYQLDALNLPAEWKKFEGKVLAVYGKSDFVSTRAEHEQLAQTVNYYHPGNGTFLEIENSDHGFATAANFMEARYTTLGGGGKFNPSAMLKIGEWMKNNLKGKS